MSSVSEYASEPSLLGTSEKRLITLEPKGKGYGTGKFQIDQ